MAASKPQITTSRSRLALGLLLFIDALTFVSLDEQGGQLVFGLSASGLPIAVLAIDLLLAYGLFKARRWALELARYRCIMGVCYLAFLWISLFMLMDHTRAVAFSTVVTAAAFRDSLIGFALIITLFTIREQKTPVVPKAETAAENTGEKASEPAPKD